ncbi:hypothetical protein B0H13DRAFT_801033 [Mycena leptocephala]|nr:hypothetical protein B0H13DRAFT_801033 [Mycena leptocephala]
MNRWKHRIIEGYSREVAVDDFFSMYMKGDRKPAPAKIAEIVKKCSAQLQKTATDIKKNTIELKMYPTFVKYAQKISEHLPSATKPAFKNTTGTTFKRLHPTDHDSRPDVSSPLPGVEPPKVWEWHHVGTVIEFKVKDDPFDAQGGIKSGQLENLVQLLKNARCILMASGNYYVFVVSVFRNNARFFRVDRCGYIVSESFDWSKNERIFPEFYWRLYNGAKGGRLLGHDSTVSAPTEDEKVKMYEQLQKLPQYQSMTFEEATGRSRWAKVIFNEEDTRAFTVGAPIFQSKGLFGRGTRVERVLIEGEDRMFAMKDAWRQVCRRPESHFYDVIQDYAETRAEEDDADGKMNGLATCLGSIDLSKLHPEHKTITAGLRVGGDALLDRCHDRSLFTPVGFTLDKFHSTKELVQALRSAIAGHQFAFMAGVLHRDISAGNVLISEDGPGFLLDFDYSEFTEDGLVRFNSLHPDFLLEEIDKDMKDITGTYPFMSITSLVHMAGMKPGEVHKHSSEHDLESFYWLLVWLLLRHAEHNHPAGSNACSRVFDGEAYEVFDHKSSWLAHMGFGGPRLLIRNNPPLTALVDALNTIFRTQNTDQTPATHESLLAAFDKAIGSAGWPENDTAKEFVLPFVSLGMPPPPTSDAMSNAGSQVGGGSAGYWKQRAKAAVVVPRSEHEVDGASGSPSGIKRKHNEGMEEGPVQSKRRSTRTRNPSKR